MAKDNIKDEGPQKGSDKTKELEAKKLEADLKKMHDEEDLLKKSGGLSKGDIHIESGRIDGLGGGNMEEVVRSGPTIAEGLAAYPGGFLVDKKGAIYEIGFISQHFHAIENRYPRAREGQMYAFVQRGTKIL